ncbi:motility protein A [Aneurinibacillus aneurinilyticus]|jgi:chemotaxis protein MotA|uniref:Motility protein A n=2 Tax=Aneurinibacillus aneurinilyticus TaxID=1391 RepID=A0A848D5J8_ANEAE|nr:MotA/TolQ/ExbB proton channel family protein [Aneurinibacillus aneurinilyticus]ERI07528.1 putative chemotaxis protein MotA [Aneurinibacillus aneurinilyticus ATCC 12856]MCI1696935.1 MotA/TolQ/ExbB proton channel family protein [Aneurinibacillus aneurinilyticus]MED0673000.1 MotA/TolQ/ExbB proton channel family protein [Aneurinibacillus aneurinilyticus]MED0709530.1 MotA/TolQ/ExbB proton channel family protein [Aneurinibacillus aneurinilyticus]MED0726611.1 MotA/TolQ/ExbB proton channel family p
MDLASLIGIAIALAAAAFGFFYDGGTPTLLWSASSFVLVLGGTIGAVTLSLPMKELKNVPKLFKKLFTEQKMDYLGLVNQMEELAGKARREGLLSLEQEIEQVDNKFIARGLRSAIDGVDQSVIGEMLEYDISAMESRHQRGAKIFENAGGYCPTIGIMGTVMHMVVIMTHLNEPHSLGPSISAAFLATLYGVAFANLFFFPFAEKLKAKSKDESLYLTIALEGIIGVQQGMNPVALREKLLVFLSEADRNIEAGGEEINVQKEAEA